MRREFSANVSHELKTPLTSIIGYAEIMQNGIAKQEDSSKFISLIYSEGQRLLSLIEDIIKISRLEENSAKDKQELLESVDICSICSSVVKELEHKAREFNVSFKTCLRDPARPAPRPRRLGGAGADAAARLRPAPLAASARSNQSMERLR